MAGARDRGKRMTTEGVAVPITTSAEFGSHLRDVRGRLTQAAVARRSVVGRSALTRQRTSNIENGLLPTRDQLRCFLHGCGRGDLFEELDAVRAAVETRSGEVCRLDGQDTDAGPDRRGGPRVPRWVRLVGGVVAVVGFSAATVALVGVGKPVEPECAENFICFWSEADFGGRKLQQPPDWISTTHCIRLPHSVRSVMNNSRERQRGYANSDCSDAGTVLQHLGAVEREVDFNAYKHT
ncbi:helix-turn-helix transcriptional regulator [Actinosynnema sp. NPDC050436]|uniref:helix-turn-helix domain-containing protein n=1 Tax=Actinosynnema sp. NPDC050436 TaxID=3155659 RepID=UPI0033C0088B